jgi:hypothetical protein
MTIMSFSQLTSAPASKASPALRAIPLFSNFQKRYGVFQHHESPHKVYSSIPK